MGAVSVLARSNYYFEKPVPPFKGLWSLSLDPPRPYTLGAVYCIPVGDRGKRVAPDERSKQPKAQRETRCEDGDGVNGNTGE